MKRILCPFDFSETANNALVYAAQFARERDAELVVYHVKLMFNMGLVQKNTESEDSIEDTSERLLQLTKDVTRAFSIPCYAEIEPTTHNLAASISERTDTADIVIMGTNGADDLTHHFVGTNAYRAAVKSRTPFLIIPNGTKYDALNTVLYAFDYGAKQKLPLASLKKWIKTSGARVSVLQVLEDAHDEHSLQKQKHLESTLLRQHSETLKHLHSIFAVDVAEAIHDYVIENDFDALALCTVERNFMEGLFHKSVISQLSARANYPLFILHE